MPFGIVAIGFDGVVRLRRSGAGRWRPTPKPAACRRREGHVVKRAPRREARSPTVRRSLRLGGQELGRAQLQTNVASLVADPRARMSASHCRDLSALDGRPDDASHAIEMPIWRGEERADVVHVRGEGYGAVERGFSHADLSGRVKSGSAFGSGRRHHPHVAAADQAMTIGQGPSAASICFATGARQPRDGSPVSISCA